MIVFRLCAAALLALLATSAGGHPATERYVPMGYWASIGVKNTYTGDVADVAADQGSLSYVTNGRRTTVRVDARTRIYVDRSHLGEKSRIGSRSELRPGRRMEIRLRTDGSGIADWIKVRD